MVSSLPKLTYVVSVELEPGTQGSKFRAQVHANKKENNLGEMKIPKHREL